MTPRDPNLYLHDMLDSARFLHDLMPSKSIEDYLRDRIFRSGVQRELTIIGEALYTLNKVDPALASQITAHAQIIAFRHILVHGYHTLDPEIVWSVLTDKLSPLLEDLTRLLGEADLSD